MHSLIAKILQKKGVESLDQLETKPLPDGSPSEKQVFEAWQAVLSKEELTLEDVKDFCQSQLNFIEGKWGDLNISNEKKAELIPYHTTYKTLLAAIDAPRSARERLEKQLENLIKTI